MDHPLFTRFARILCFYFQQLLFTLRNWNYLEIITIYYSIFYSYLLLSITQIIHILIPNINHRCLLMRETYVIERLLLISNKYQDGSFSLRYLRT